MIVDLFFKFDPGTKVKRPKSDIFAYPMFQRNFHVNEKKGELRSKYLGFGMDWDQL